MEAVSVGAGSCMDILADTFPVCHDDPACRLRPFVFRRRMARLVPGAPEENPGSFVGRHGRIVSGMDGIRVSGGRFRGVPDRKDHGVSGKSFGFKLCLRDGKAVFGGQHPGRGQRCEDIRPVGAPAGIQQRLCVCQSGHDLWHIGGSAGRSAVCISDRSDFPDLPAPEKPAGNDPGMRQRPGISFAVSHAYYGKPESAAGGGGKSPFLLCGRKPAYCILYSSGSRAQRISL